MGTPFDVTAVATVLLTVGALIGLVVLAAVYDELRALSPGTAGRDEPSVSQMSKPDPPSRDEIRTLIPHIRRVIKSRGVPSSDEWDLVQSVLIGAWSAIMEGRYLPDPAVGLCGWVREIARRQVSNYWRRARARREQLTDPDELAKERDQWQPDELLVQEYESRREELLLTELLETRDPKLSVLVAHDIEGLAMEQIAKERNVPLSTVYRWRATALTSLRKLARQRSRA
jgi:RNA polymerase sigma-70 factor, ECF subfamily